VKRVAVALVLVGCDGGAAPAAAQPVKAAEAPPDDGAAKRKAEREQKAAAQEKQKADYLAALDALAVLPPKLPKGLEPACKQMLAAYDGFMRKVLTGDMLTKWTTGGNEMRLAVFRKECLKRNVETAACQAHALEQAGPELEPRLADLMGRCNEKFGGGAAASAPPPR
jgi:hypothetical protein